MNSNGSDQHWLLELDTLDTTVYNKFKDFFSQLDLEVVKLAIIYKYEVYSIYNEEFYCGDGNSIHLLYVEEYSRKSDVSKRKKSGMMPDFFNDEENFG